jgi:uroporphyrinogen-III synthase
MCRVLVTRESVNYRPLADLLVADGFTPISLPLIATVAIESSRSRVWDLINSRNSDNLVIVFNSPNGVVYFHEALASLALTTDWSSFQFVAQGNKTAIKIRNLIPEASNILISPFRTSAEMGRWLIDVFRERPVSFILFGALVTSPLGCEYVIRQAGYSCDSLPVYTTELVSLDLKAKEIAQSFYHQGIVTFFSPSALKSWCKNGLMNPYYTASFGPVTSAALRAVNFSVNFEADNNVLSELVRNLKESVGNSPFN